MAKIGITETVLRDAHQSLIATRMRTDEFEGIGQDRLSFSGVLGRCHF